MECIVNVTPNWGIGRENRLLVSVSADLKRFRALTAGKTVILGRKTLQTFPGGKPLSQRRNLILSAGLASAPPGAEIFPDLEALLRRLQALPRDQLCVIGGESVYRALLPYCDRARITKTHIALPADRFFPNLDLLPQWRVVDQSPLWEENGVVFQYIDYQNQEPRPL